MADKPILFSAPMVNAILRGDKTQTRRVIKPALVAAFDVGRGSADSASGYPFVENEYGDHISAIKLAPYQPGDLLWVRETYAMHTVAGETLPVYRADCYPDGDGAPWKSPIFMPRRLSRITLRVTNVRAQRVQDISEDDAAAEGIERHSGPYILDFARLWDSINAKRGYSWNSNPFVWVYTFDVQK